MTNNTVKKKCKPLRKHFTRPFFLGAFCLSALVVSCNKSDNSAPTTPPAGTKTIDTPVAKWAYNLRSVSEQRSDLIGSSDSIYVQPDSVYTRYIYEVISGRSLAPDGTAAKFLAGEYPYDWQLDTNNLSAGFHIATTAAGGTAQFDGKYPAYYSFSQHTLVKITVDDSVRGGMYSYVLRGSNPKLNDGYKLYIHGKLVVPVKNTDCVTDRLGVYSGTASCAQNGTGSGSGTVTAVAGVPNRIRFVADNGVSIYADLSCTAKLLTIPPQSIASGIDVQGSGTFGTGTMTFQLTYSGSVTDTCRYTLQK